MTKKLVSRIALSIATATLSASALVLSAPAAHAQVAACPVSSTDLAIDAEEQALLNLINQYRVANGRNSLTFRSSNTKAASWLSRDMATKNYLSHTDSNGRGMAARLTWCGVPYTSAAENIAAGYSTGQGVFNAWKASSGHNTNMLRTGVSYAGIARAYNANSTYKWYWTFVVTN